MKDKQTLRLFIYTLLLIAFFSGIPQLHYVTALMIALIIRHKDVPGGLLAPVSSTPIAWPQGR
jgi:hypothetical protein